MSKKRTGLIIEYKGYAIYQSGYDNHIMIMDENGKMVFHCQKAKKCTKKELEKEVEFFLQFTEENIND